MRLLAPLLGILLATGCSIDVRDETVESRDEKVFTVTGPVTLAVSTFDGSIEVESWNRNEVRVAILRRASREQQLADLEVTTTQDGGRVVVEAREPQRRSDLSFRGGSSVSFLISAPRNTSLQARTGDGPVAARDLSGTVTVDTGDGPIRLERLEGELTLRTGDGSVDVTAVRGRVRAETGDGPVQVSGVLNGLSVRTGDGGVQLSAESGSAMQDDWQITTGDGPIAVALPAAFDAEVDASSGDGPIHVEGLPPPADGDEPRHAVNGRLGKGGRTLRLQSGDGGIDVRVR